MSRRREFRWSGIRRLSLLVAVLCMAILAVPMGPGITRAADVPVSGDFMITSGTWTGTYNTSAPYQLLTGDMIVSGGMSGDLDGSFDMTATLNTTDGTVNGSSAPASATLTDEDGTHPATYMGRCSGTNFVIAPPGYPTPSQCIWDYSGEGWAWTTDGSNRFVRFAMSGSCSATYSWPAPGQYSVDDITSAGTWSGTISTLETAPEVQQVTGNTPGTVTLDSPQGTVAEVDYSTDSSGTIVLAQYESNPGGTPVILMPGEYVEISTDIVSPDINWPVELRVHYTHAELAARGIKESSLKMQRWDGSNWVDVAGSTVNMAEDYVSAQLYSFSTYGIGGAPSNEVATATGSGTAGLGVTIGGGTLVNLAAVRESSLPEGGAKPPDMLFPHGFFEFDITGLTPGETVTLAVWLPSNVPAGSQYWKWNSTLGWYQIFMGDNDGDNMVTIQLTDGGTGDDDGAINGIINDQGGPGWPPFGGGGATSAPVFPSIYIGIAAAMGAGILAYFMHRRLATR
jgi:hypothetical protein